MSPIMFTGECWISDANERPGLDDGRFGVGWNHIGNIGRDQREFWEQVKTPSSRRSVGFDIAIFQEDLTELPKRFWLGVEWLTEQFYVATGPADPRALESDRQRHTRA